MNSVIISGITYTKSSDKVRWWALEDIHIGPNTGKHIARVRDRVENIDTGEKYKVIDVDQVTGIAMLELIDDTDCNTTRMMYVDTNTTPPSITVDGTFTVTGDVGYAVAYYLNNTGNSISEVYDHAGDFDTDRIPVRRVNSNSHEPLAVYNIDRWHSSESVINGTLITLKVYDIYDNVISSTNFLVSDVSPLNDAAHTAKTIRSVALLTPFMDDGDVIRRPITVTVSDLNLVVQVTYEDGETALFGTDHDRVQIAGLDIVGLNNTSLTHDIMVVFKTMGDPVHGPLDTNGIITVPYHIINYIPAKEFGHSLQLYPIYVNNAEGYRMSGALTLADRSMIMDVTPHLSYLTPLDGTEMGTLQEVECVLDLRYIHTLPEEHTLTKTVWITLNNNGGEVEAPWVVSGPFKHIKPYSISNAVGTSYVTLTNDVVGWWDEYYPLTEPMMLSGIEVEPPIATHIIVHDTLAGDIELHKSEIDTTIAFNELLINDVIHITFIQKLGSQQIKLSHLPIYI